MGKVVAIEAAVVIIIVIAIKTAVIVPVIVEIVVIVVEVIVVEVVVVIVVVAKAGPVVVSESVGESVVSQNQEWSIIMSMEIKTTLPWWNVVGLVPRWLG